MKKQAILVALLALGIIAVNSAFAQTPGVTPSEIKIGQTLPYSGPVSALGVIGKAEAAYYQMINDRGGVNGRKIKMISLDDAYSPPKTFEQTRKLVEQEEVAFISGTVGGPPNMAIRKYMNDQKVPHLFLRSGVSALAEPDGFPWSMMGILSYGEEARLYAVDILKTKPDAKIALLYSNDDTGKDYALNFKAGLGDKASQIVSSTTYETSDPTVDSQVVIMAASGADVLFVHATPKFAVQTLRRKSVLGWKPRTYLSVTAASQGSVLEPAGYDNAEGALSVAWQKEPGDPQWANDPGILAYSAWMDKYFPGANKADSTYKNGYQGGDLTVRLLEKCGNDLSRANILKQAQNLDFELPLLLPGMRFQTSPTDYSPIKNGRLQVFKTNRWVLM